MNNLSQIEQMLTAYQPRSYWFKTSEQAAVALILRESVNEKNGTSETQVLMMQRAMRKGDPWSGHMAFPGGKKERSDESLKDCAIREVYEEIGLHLKPNQCIGRLSDRITRTHSNKGLMKVSAWIFKQNNSIKEPNDFSDFIMNHEAQSLHWIPLSLFSKENRQTMHWKIGKIAGLNIKLKLPKYLFDEKVIWGLSLRMLDEFIKITNKR